MVRLAVAYDGSPHAAAALDAAARIFAGASAVVLTAPRPATAVFPTGLGVAAPLVDETFITLDAELRDAAREVAEAGAAQARAAGLDAAAEITDNAPPTWRGLLAAAVEAGADVLVCGSRGHGSFKRAALGSTSTSLLHNATLPLLVVDQVPESLDGPSLLAFDGSDHAKHAIDVAARVLPDRPAFVAHAWESPYKRTLTGRALSRGPVDDIREIVAGLEERISEHAAGVLKDGIIAAREGGLTASGAIVETGDGPWRALAQAAEDQNAAVIVTGSRGLGGVRSALLGSTSAGLIQNADRPVLVVPHE